jgi:hypothetical protein
MRIMLAFMLLGGALGLRPVSYAQDAKPSQNTKPSHSLTLTTSQDAVRVGSPILVNVTVTNFTDREMIDSMIKGEPIPKYAVVMDIRDSQGNARPDTEEYRQLKKSMLENPRRTGSVAFSSLKPGESDHDTIEVNRYFDMSEAGIYTIQLREPDFDGKPGVKSNAITVTVTEAAGGTQPIEGSQAPFSLTIATRQDAVRAGSEVTLETFLTNTSNHVVEFDFAVTKLDLQVRDSRGNLVPLTKDGQELQKQFGARGGNLVPVQPGKTERGDILLDRVYDLSQPGTYTIQVHRLDETSKTVVKSNTITLIVTP